MLIDELRIEHGPTGRLIAPVVCEMDADLIALSTRPRDGLGATWLGGVSEAVVASANQPLLLVSEA